MGKGCDKSLPGYRNSPGSSYLSVPRVCDVCARGPGFVYSPGSRSIGERLGWGSEMSVLRAASGQDYSGM